MTIYLATNSQINSPSLEKGITQTHTMERVEEVVGRAAIMMQLHTSLRLHFRAYPVAEQGGKGKFGEEKEEEEGEQEEEEGEVQ